VPERAGKTQELISIGNDFLSRTQMLRQLREKIDKWDYMKLKFLHDKRNGHQIEEAAQRVGENLCQQYIGLGINCQNIQGAQKTKLPKTYDPIKKWANELNGAFSKDEVQMAKNT
jgi:hypothetical protein